MKHYLYLLLFTCVLLIGTSVHLNAQATPNASSTSATSDNEGRTNYNYLGLLGLLGLYGLHKKRGKEETVIDRKAL